MIFIVSRKPKIDSFQDHIFSLLNKSDTKYSEGYTDERFMQIKSGMKLEEVYNLLGEPLYKSNKENNILGLQYSESPTDTHYFVRYVSIKNNRVKEVINYFYID